MGNGSQLPRSELVGNLLRRLWRFLGSTRLAALLLAALLLAALLASLLPQMPPDPAARGPWLAAVRLRYGGTTDWLQALGLFDAYHAPWFLALLATLLLNTFVCTLQRLPRLWASFTRQPVVARPEAFYHGSVLRAEWPVPSIPAGLTSAEQILIHHRYRTSLERNEAAGSAHLYAERGRWAQSGTVVSHTAAVLLLLAVLARPALTWIQRGVTLLPGSEYPVDRRPGLAVRAGRLVIDRHPDGQPRDYRVPLAIVVDASPVLTRTVRLNQPLTVRGINFHLQGYGPAAQLVVPEGTFDLSFADGQTQEITLPQTGLVLRLAYQPEGGTLFLEAWTADGTLLGSGTVADGEQITVEGTPIACRLGHYTTWQISDDPTFALALAAAGLLLAGLLISLWVPQRRLWLWVDDQGARLAASGDVAGQFEVLAAEMAAASRPEEETDGR